ncbi:hypothetical protein [Paraherbaspirillum soli]|uniref:CdiI immunity protein domain-containing protein n=1 Tax=Paraherbaspirillum soli TaxID=631222 RepID=A0ABW0MFK1_9BURK
MSYIIIGLIDTTLPSLEENLSGDSTNSTAWDAFGDMLNEVLKDHCAILESIKSEEWIYQKIYSFIALSGQDFNVAIKAIHDYVIELDNPTDWQKWGENVWKEVVEPLVVKDHRYLP